MAVSVTRLASRPTRAHPIISFMTENDDVKWIVIGSAFTLALWALGGWGGDQEVVPTEENGSAEALAALAASPCDAGSSFGIADSTVADLLTGASRLDAEIHDCQRLVLSTGPTGEFGPL